MSIRSVTAFDVSSGGTIVPGASPQFWSPPSSLATTDRITNPTWFGAGVYVSVPVGEIAGAAENRPGFKPLVGVTTKWTCWPDSLAGPGLTAVAQDPLNGVSSLPEIWAGPAVNVGVSLIGAIQNR